MEVHLNFIWCHGAKPYKGQNDFVIIVFFSSLFFSFLCFSMFKYTFLCGSNIFNILLILCSSFAIGENDFVELPSSFLRIKIKYIDSIKMVIKWEYALYTRWSKVLAHSILKMWNLTLDSFGYHQANPQISSVTFIFYFDSDMEWYVWCLKDRRVYNTLFKYLQLLELVVCYDKDESGSWNVDE